MRHIVEGDPVKRCMDVLDKMSTPQSIGRPKAIEALKAGGDEFAVNVVTDAVKQRKAAQLKPAQEAA